MLVQVILVVGSLYFATGLYTYFVYFLPRLWKDRFPPLLKLLIAVEGFFLSQIWVISAFKLALKRRHEQRDRQAVIRFGASVLAGTTTEDVQSISIQNDDGTFQQLDAKDVKITSTADGKQLVSFRASSETLSLILQKMEKGTHISVGYRCDIDDVGESDGHQTE